MEQEPGQHQQRGTNLEDAAVARAFQVDGRDDPDDREAEEERRRTGQNGLGLLPERHATGAAKPTVAESQPAMKPKAGPYIRVRKLYSPLERGNIVASSA